MRVAGRMLGSLLLGGVAILGSILIFRQGLLPLIEEGRIDPTVIISHRLPLSDGPRGYDIFAHHKENVLKVVLQP